MNLKKVLNLEPKNKTAKLKQDEVCAKMKVQLNCKSNKKKNKNKKKLTIDDEDNEEFEFNKADLITQYEVINPKTAVKVEEVKATETILNKSSDKKKNDDIMEEDKFEETLNESKPEGVSNKLNKLDHTPNPEIKTKKRLKSQGSDTENIPEKTDTNLNCQQSNNNKDPNEIVINSIKKDSKPRKIKITQLSKKAKPNNFSAFSQGISSYSKDHEKGWE